MPDSREGLRIVCVPKHGGFVVTLEGVINEHAELRRRLEGLSGAVVIDLDKVSKITSFGVREWMNALRALRADYYAFVRCPPAMITQFNVVAGFGGQGELVSFYAPYICPACEVDFTHLIDLRRHHALISCLEPPAVTCPDCGSAASFDDSPGQFFSYAGSRPRPQLPQTAHQLIDAGTGVDTEAFSIRKEVANVVTALWMTGALTPDAHLSRPLDGLEGFVLSDMSGVESATTEGVLHLVETLSMTDIRHLCFARVRPSLFVPLVMESRGLRFPHGIASLLMKDRCRACNQSADFEVWCDRISTSPGGATATVPCPLCTSPRELRIPPELASIAAHGAAPIPQEIASFMDRRGMPAKTKTPNPRTASMPSSAARSAPSGSKDVELDVIVGESPILREILDAIRKVAPSDATVLIRGETGVGKEMMARSVHLFSARRDKPFVAVNCAALPAGIIESELFGHEKGSFTGAMARSIGRFERANGGTLFIDEIGDMPLSVQAKLLRALQEHYIERVGGSEAIPVDIRLVAATHRPLEEMMRDGSFREDLFYRLNVVPIFVPSLRERRQDIWPLAMHYLEVIQEKWGKSGIRFADSVRAALEDHSWPGNVRELVNVVERAVALTPSGGEATLAAIEPQRSQPVPPAARTPTIPPIARAQTIPPPARTSPNDRPVLERATSGGKLKDAVDEYERQLISEALTNAAGNRTRAAKELGISRQALGQKIAKYNL